MNNQKGYVYIFFIIYLIGILGWCVNVYKTTQLDFASPYKAEIIRVIGIFTPISAITGWVTLDEEEKK